MIGRKFRGNPHPFLLAPEGSANFGENKPEKNDVVKQRKKKRVRRWAISKLNLRKRNKKLYIKLEQASALRVVLIRVVTGGPCVCLDLLRWLSNICS